MGDNEKQVQKTQQTINVTANAAQQINPFYQIPENLMDWERTKTERTKAKKDTLKYVPRKQSMLTGKGMRRWKR